MYSGQRFRLRSFCGEIYMNNSYEADSHMIAEFSKHGKKPIQIEFVHSRGFPPRTKNREMFGAKVVILASHYVQKA